MNLLYKLLHRKKDDRLRNDPLYIGLLDFGFVQTNRLNREYGLGFEKTLDGFLCLVYLRQGKVVTTIFFQPFQSAGNALSLLDQFLDDDLSVGRNFIESRIPFESLSTEDINKTVTRLLAIVKSEGLTPIDKKSDVTLRHLH